MSVSISFSNKATKCITPKQSEVLVQRLEGLLRIVGVDGHFGVMARQQVTGSSSLQKESLKFGFCLGVMNEDKDLIFFTLQTNGNGSCYLYEMKMPDGVKVKDVYFKFKDAYSGKLVAKPVVKSPVAGRHIPHLSVGTLGRAPVIGAVATLPPPPAVIHVPDSEKSGSGSPSAEVLPQGEEGKSAHRGGFTNNPSNIPVIMQYVKESADAAGKLTKEDLYNAIGKCFNSDNNYQIGQIVRWLKDQEKLFQIDKNTYSLSKLALVPAVVPQAKVEEPKTAPQLVAPVVDVVAVALNDMSAIKACVQRYQGVKAEVERQEGLLFKNQKLISDRYAKISILEKEIHEIEQEGQRITESVKEGKNLLADPKMKNLVDIFNLMKEIMK